MGPLSLRSNLESIDEVEISGEIIESSSQDMVMNKDYLNDHKHRKIKKKHIKLH